MALLGLSSLYDFRGSSKDYADIDTTAFEVRPQLTLNPYLPKTMDLAEREALTDAFNRVIIRVNQNTLAVQTITTSQAVLADVVLVDAGASIVTVTLVTASAAPAYIMSIKKLNGNTANVVKIVAQSGETIDGTATRSLAAQYATLTVASDGKNWYEVGNV
jgi:hypothetical protein